MDSSLRRNDGQVKRVSGIRHIQVETVLVRSSYALMRIAAHHLIHAGEIVTVRSCLGHDTAKLGRPDWGRPLA